jgi:hypothetical protein
VLAAVFWLALPGTASARNRHHHHRAKPTIVKLWTAPEILALALQDAEEYWQGAGHHEPPCGGDIHIEGSEGWEALGLTGASWWSSWSEPNGGDAMGAQVSASTFRNCQVRYALPYFTPTPALWTRCWPELATDIAHELEHLENRWWLETEVDGGPLALGAVPTTAVNFPAYTGENEPATAIAHHPPGAPAQGHEPCNPPPVTYE